MSMYDQHSIMRLRHYKEQFLLLRNTIDLLIEAMDKDLPPPEGGLVRKRRSLKEQRVQQFIANHIKGTWSKPEELKKGGKKKGLEKRWPPVHLSR